MAKKNIAQVVAQIKTILGFITQADADERYPQIADGDPTPIYTASEVDVFLKQARKSELLKTLQAQGSMIKALPAGASSLFYGTQIMTDSRPYQCTFVVEEEMTITGVGYQLLTQGNFVADNYNGFFLCSVNGANYTVIASTANDATLWKKAASIYSTKDFTAPVVLSSGIYKLFGVYNTSDASPVAAPAFTTCQGIGASYAGLLINGHKMEGYISGVIIAVPSVPFASSTINASAIQPSFLLY